MTDTQNYFIDGEAYERLMGRFTRAAGEVFVDWLSAPKGLDWIDVGCGTGAFTQLLLDRCAPKTVSAVDPSVEQIAYARTTPAAERVDFQIGAAQSLPFDDATFDAGMMALVITFVPDPNKAVAELRRVTKPRRDSRHLYVGHLQQRPSAKSAARSIGKNGDRSRLPSRPCTLTHGQHSGIFRIGGT